MLEQLINEELNLDQKSHLDPLFWTNLLLIKYPGAAWTGAPDEILPSSSKSSLMKPPLSATFYDQQTTLTASGSRARLYRLP